MNSPSLNLVRCVQLAFLIAAAPIWLALAASTQQPEAAANDHRQPVLVELFTSEGCSDCPPADALLAKLDKTQFVPGVEAIVLSEHVTYWNRLGWHDPFSFDAMTERQRQYVARFALDSSYTPQVVVDGAAQVVGNDTEAVTAAVARASSKTKADLAIANARWEEGAVQFSVHGTARAGTTLVAVVAEDATRSEVARGENAGRTLHHVAVVRVLKEFDAHVSDGRTLRLTAQTLSRQGQAAGPVRLIVFLADRKTGYVTAVAEKTLGK
jgi:hypothetical protein